MPAVVAEAPPAWIAAEVEPPKLQTGTGAELSQWRAVRSPDGAATFITGCVATPIPGWVEDMRPAVEARTTALAGASTERITGVPIDARPDGQGALILRSARDLAGPRLGVARTLVGFDARRVLACFATCAGTPGVTEAALECDAAVAGARLEGSGPPPSPGWALRVVTWAVHHPKPAAATGAGAAAAAALLAVITRRRPRSLARR